MYYYTATIGSKELNWFGGDDSQARRKVALWVAMFWERHCKGYAKHSLGAVMNEAPTITIGRIWCEQKGVVPFKRYAVIDKVVWDGETKLQYDRGMLCGVNKERKSS